MAENQLRLTNKIRIETILHRLDSPHPRLLNPYSNRLDGHDSVESRYDTRLSNTVDTALIGSEEQPLIPEPTLDVVRKDWEGLQSTQNQLKQSDSPPPGLLQTPNWLTELQSEVSNGWRDMNTQAEPEPVVNVTIGRVEVRAVQAESEKQPETRKKPSGVLSLEDYLEQRNRERL